MFQFDCGKGLRDPGFSAFETARLSSPESDGVPNAQYLFYRISNCRHCSLISKDRDIIGLDMAGKGLTSQVWLGARHHKLSGFKNYEFIGSGAVRPSRAPSLYATG